MVQIEPLARAPRKPAAAPAPLKLTISSGRTPMSRWLRSGVVKPKMRKLS